MADRLIFAVSGASGFVGRALLGSLAKSGDAEARGLYRVEPAESVSGTAVYVAGDLSRTPVLGQALSGVDVVIHTAARTHVLDDRTADPLAAYRAINVTGTLNLARAAAASGVKRLVYLSSIKVNGESTPIDRPFTEADPPAPLDVYGATKWEAEQALHALSRETGLEIVVLRPPLVYGRRVKGNLQRLIRLVASGTPLPLASARNARSMVGLDNLVSATLLAVRHPSAAGRTFLVSDQSDLSTPELIRAIAAALSRPANLWPFPPSLLVAAASLLGRRAEIDRLIGSLRVDSTAISGALGWRPTVVPAEGIRDMVASGGL